MGISLFYSDAWEVQKYRPSGSMHPCYLILCLLHLVLSIGNTTLLFVIIFFYMTLFTIVSEYVPVVHKL